MGAGGMGVFVQHGPGDLNDAIDFTLDNRVRELVGQQIGESFLIIALPLGKQDIGIHRGTPGLRACENVVRTVHHSIEVPGEIVAICSIRIIEIVVIIHKY